MQVLPKKSSFFTPWRKLSPMTFDEVRTVLQVGHDTAYVGGCQYHRSRLFRVEELTYSYGVQQVQFLVRTSHQVGISPLQQVVPDGRSHQSVVSGYVYFG